MASLASIVDYLDLELRVREVPDYPGAINGLQFQNNGTVSHVAAAVDFSSAAVTRAAELGADLLVVHHGMFWGGPSPVTGPAYDRAATLLSKNIAVYSSHIPLDLHPRFGNNALLARELGLTPNAGFALMRGVHVGVSGEADVPTRALRDRAAAFSARYGGALITTPVSDAHVTRRWGICTGAGASTDTLKEAADLQLDTLIVGEGTHHTAVHAMNTGLTLMYLGHYATETLGVIALAEELARRFKVKSSFVEAPTGL